MMPKKPFTLIALAFILLPVHSASAKELRAISDQGEIRTLIERPVSNAAPARTYPAAVSPVSGFEQFGNIKSMILDGIYSTTSGNLTTLANLRIDSDRTTLNDYISIDMILDAESLRMFPIKTAIVKNLGVYNDDKAFFSTNIRNPPIMVTPGGNVLQADRLHTLSSTTKNAYTMELKAGTVLTFRLRNPTDDLELILKYPDGHESSGLYEKGSNWFISGYTILTSGKHTLRFVPKNNASINLRFGFSNQNSRFLQVLKPGQPFSTRLSGWGEQYAKYKIRLKAGDTVDISAPSDNDVGLYLLDANGKDLEYSIGGKLLEKVDYAGNYYLFVRSEDYANPASYSGKITVTPDPKRKRYPVLAKLAKQTAKVGKNFDIQLLARKKPTEFKALGLPNGLAINPKTGRISGAPETAGLFAITAIAKNKFGGDRKDFILEVFP